MPCHEPAAVNDAEVYFLSILVFIFCVYVALVLCLCVFWVGLAFLFGWFGFVFLCCFNRSNLKTTTIQVPQNKIRTFTHTYLKSSFFKIHRSPRIATSASSQFGAEPDL